MYVHVCESVHVHVAMTVETECVHFIIRADDEVENKRSENILSSTDHLCTSLSMMSFVVPACVFNSYM